ncbi:MAG: mechanosensitive ion channel family protein [Chitinispirillaceae bacterium]|nr:mechanosensitive ion channel family protein [Chitinispirillaceae bacterium]
MEQIQTILYRTLWGIEVWVYLTAFGVIFAGLWMERAKRTESKLDDQLIPIVRRSSKVFFFVIGVVLVLQNMGYSVGSLIAGLGIGAVAIAMASKDTVANLFGSLMIFLDKPFHIGDWIEMGSIEGTVEVVGLRTTRIRTFANSLITMPNSMFTTGAINN